MPFSATNVRNAFKVLREKGIGPNSPSRKWEIIDPATNERFPPKAVLRVAKELAGDTSYTGGGGWPTNDPLRALGFEVVLKDGLEEADEAIDIAGIFESDMDSTTKRRLMNARLGQGGFREALLEIWDGRCAVTDCSVSAVLRASHIKPWRQSSNVERLDPANGVLLAASIDALFDRWLISFDGDGYLIIGSGLSFDDLIAIGVSRGARLRNRRLPDKYISHHRKAFLATCEGNYRIFK